MNARSYRPLALSLAGSVLAGLAAPVAAQQLSLNELYISHSGVDDQEFIELVGAPGASLDNVVIVIVESDNGTSAGTVDAVFDLTGFNVGADGYFVAGTSAVSGVDLVLGSDNLIENSSETIYLIDATSPAAVAALLTTNVATGPDTTSLASQGTILDLVSIVDADAGDISYDGATPVGPDAVFLPAGIYRGGDFPNDWCTQLFLDFSVGTNELQPRTPGAPNTPCAFFADVTEISVSTGGTQSFTLDAGAANAGQLFWIVGSATGVAPGFPVGTVTLPIAFDFYTNVTLSNANSGPFSNTFANLDGSGQASASITLVGGTALALAGTTLYHSYGVIDLAGPTVSFASNALAVELMN